ncbi:Bgt-51701 [Blumeria graminis f. sp. tritici]|uniref:Bgt-51701 n=1 Tax=Blumeria graminis f. sp. tritici TaxID=62690 RepID=A0A9X9MEF2_BLUGR|nr:Bgt-51701 [Blumeria graminis f. sp. tritici]
MERLKILLCRELHGLVYINGQGFWKKYFANKLWEDNCIGLAKEFMKRSAEDDFEFPETPTEKLVWNRMKAVEKKIFESSSKTCVTSKTTSSSSSEGDVHHLNKTPVSNYESKRIRWWSDSSTG